MGRPSGSVSGVSHLTYDVIISRPYRAYLAGRADGELM